MVNGIFSRLQLAIIVCFLGGFHNIKVGGKKLNFQILGLVTLASTIVLGKLFLGNSWIVSVVNM